MGVPLMHNVVTKAIGGGTMVAVKNSKTAVARRFWASNSILVPATAAASVLSSRSSEANRRRAPAARKRDCSAHGSSGARAAASGATLMGRFGAPHRRRRRAEPIRDPRMAFGFWPMKFLLYEGVGASRDDPQARRDRCSLSLAMEGSQWWRPSTG